MKSIDVNQLSIISEESITAVENYFHKLLTVEEEKVPALILLKHVHECVKLLVMSQYCFWCVYWIYCAFQTHFLSLCPFVRTALQSSCMRTSESELICMTHMCQRSGLLVNIFRDIRGIRANLLESSFGLWFTWWHLSEFSLCSDDFPWFPEACLPLIHIPVWACRM